MVPAAESADLDILDVGSCRSITRAPAFGNVASGTVKVGAVAGVEPLGQVAGELDVLALVVAHRHLVGVVEEDVGGHQGGVGEQAAGDELGPARLVLELGHALQLADRGGALHQPGQLGVLGDVALHEQRADVGVEPDGEEQLRQPQRRGPQLGRVLGHREGVQVDDAVDAVGSCWLSAQPCSAPSRLPRWTLPVGWMPEKTRVTAANVGAPGGPGPVQRSAGGPGGTTRCHMLPGGRTRCRPPSTTGPSTSCCT